MNISFGLGGRVSTTMHLGSKLKDSVGVLLPSLGGTFGLSYYFTNTFGISLFASDFVSLGDIGGSYTKYYDGTKEKEKSSFHYDISNTFSVRAGINFRIGGSLYSGYRRSYSGNSRSSYGGSSSSSNSDSKSGNTNTSNNYSLPTPQEILDELNLVRTDPKGYVKYLKQRLDSFVESNVHIDGVGRRISNHEGKAAVYECIEVLQNTLPMGALTMNENLCESALWLAKDQAYYNITGHDGSDGSTITDRVKRSGFTGMGWGENCSYGRYTARDFIMGLLIDDNVPSRGHRDNILNRKFTQVGVGLATGHATYNTVLVTDFGY